jgi:hypothetical protein
VTPRKPATGRRQRHECGPGCPGFGVPFSAEQVEESYRHHRRELEAQLARSIPTGRLRGWRPAWWWTFAEEAAAYRARPHRFERQTDYTVNSETVPEAWMRDGIERRRIEKLGRLRYLARSELLSDSEVRRILAAGDDDARVVREELAARKART